MITMLLGLFALLVISALGYFVSFWLAGGLLLGAGLIPGLILFLGDALPGKRALGNINYTLGALAAGGAAIIYEADGASIYRYDRDDKRVYRDGDWESVAGDDDSWQTYRLGLAPLVVGYEADAALQPYAVEDLPDEGETPKLLDESRGGYPLFTTHTSADDLVVHVGKYIKQIGRAGTRLYNRTEEEALKKYGGDSQMKQVWLMAMLFAAFGIMFVVTWVVLGL